MRVHPEYWRCGYGQAVISALEHRATELGHAVLQLDATVNQKAARCLYEKYEFREARHG
jgi:GNAT superfamily N-acetyltransferase